jgi:hypothetical protein
MCTFSGERRVGRTPSRPSRNRRRPDFADVQGVGVGKQDGRVCVGRDRARQSCEPGEWPPPSRVPRRTLPAVPLRVEVLGRVLEAVTGARGRQSGTGDRRSHAGNVWAPGPEGSAPRATPRPPSRSDHHRTDRHKVRVEADRGLSWPRAGPCWQAQVAASLRSAGRPNLSLIRSRVSGTRPSTGPSATVRQPTLLPLQRRRGAAKRSY